MRMPSAFSFAATDGPTPGIAVTSVVNSVITVCPCDMPASSRTKSEVEGSSRFGFIVGGIAFDGCTDVSTGVCFARTSCFTLPSTFLTEGEAVEARADCTVSCSPDEAVFTKNEFVLAPLARDVPVGEASLMLISLRTESAERRLAARCIGSCER